MRITWVIFSTLCSGNPNQGFSLQKHPSKHFNVGSTMRLVWYDVTTSHNVKSTLKQRCVRQCWNLQHSTTLKQSCVFQRWIEQRYTTSKNVVVFNVDFNNVGQRRNNAANMTISKNKKPKNKPWFKSKIKFLRFKEYAGPKNFFNFSSF